MCKNSERCIMKNNKIWTLYIDSNLQFVIQYCNTLYHIQHNSSHHIQHLELKLKAYEVYRSCLPNCSISCQKVNFVLRNCCNVTSVVGKISLPCFCGQPNDVHFQSGKDLFVKREGAIFLSLIRFKWLFSVDKRMKVLINVYFF